MNIETLRLELVALTQEHLKLWIEDIAALEKALNVEYKAEPVEGVFLDILKKQLEVTEKDCENYIWHSFWFLVRKSDRVVVGSADFKNVPDENGEVEIGYGLGKAYEGSGYMSEAVEAMCNWALAQEKVSDIIAETEASNLTSQRLLARCGFEEYRRDGSVWWRRRR